MLDGQRPRQRPAIPAGRLIAREHGIGPGWRRIARPGGRFRGFRNGPGAGRIGGAQERAAAVRHGLEAGQADTGWLLHAQVDVAGGGPMHRDRQVGGTAVASGVQVGVAVGVSVSVGSRFPWPSGLRCTGVSVAVAVSVGVGVSDGVGVSVGSGVGDGPSVGGIRVGSTAARRGVGVACWETGPQAASSPIPIRIISSPIRKRACPLMPNHSLYRSGYST
jgi:hypothetical protein